MMPLGIKGEVCVFCGTLRLWSMCNLFAHKFVTLCQCVFPCVGPSFYMLLVVSPVYGYISPSPPWVW